MIGFGSLLRSYRLRAGLGLRTFASLVDQRASVVSAIESARRAPWRDPETLSRVAEVLGLVESSNLWQKMLGLVREFGDSQAGVNPPAEAGFAEGELCWWWCAGGAPQSDAAVLGELAEFVGASIELDAPDEATSLVTPLTELAIEWQVRELLGHSESQVATAPVDVEAALENQALVKIEIVPGLIPRLSVQACVVRTCEGLTLYVDRIVADSRPLATYRHLLATCFAPWALWRPQLDRQSPAACYRAMQQDESWSQRLRDCERFALAMLLPANPVLAGAESSYSELVQQRGWLELEDATRSVRNRLAQQFAVPPALVHRRLMGWPCHLYGRIAQALAAQETTLPPLDWLVSERALRQQMLFEVR